MRKDVVQLGFLGYARRVLTISEPPRVDSKTKFKFKKAKIEISDYEKKYF